VTETAPRHLQSGERGRLPPHNLEAERSTLGALLLDVHAASQALQILTADDFYLQPHRYIFEAVADLYDRLSSADVLLVADALRSKDRLKDVGGEEYLIRLVEEVPSAANALYYAKLVRDSSIRRHLVRTCTSIIAEAYEEGADASEQLNKAEQAIYEIANRQNSTQFVPLPEMIDPVFEILDKHHRPGLTTGFTKFDEMTNGLQSDQLIIVAGRPSMGKTTFALNIARHVALELEKPVAIFSLEVARLQVVQNILCSCSKVDARKVRSGNLSPRQWEDLIETADRLRRAPIFIDDSSSLSTLEVKAKARRLKSRHKNLALIIVDYLQLMSHGRADSREQEISAISRNLKSLARDLKVPVIAVSQLSRAVESREGHRPRLSDLRESGAIEQDADLVVLLYREEYYRKDDPEAKGKAEAIIAKQRNGPTGTVHLAFFGNTMRFENLTVQTEPAF